jgi:hypothetical protein
VNGDLPEFTTGQARKEGLPEEIGIHLALGDLEGRIGRSFLKFDHVRVVVNSDGAELAKEVLPQQCVKLHVKHLLQLVQVHNGNLLRSPHILAQPDIGRAPQRISDQASGPLAVRHALQLETKVVAVNFCADDGSVGPRIQQKYGGITVHPAFHNNQRLHGAEGNSDRAGMRGIPQRDQQERQESQHAETRPVTSRARSWH